MEEGHQREQPACRSSGYGTRRTATFDLLQVASRQNAADQGFLGDVSTRFIRPRVRSCRSQLLFFRFIERKLDTPSSFRCVPRRNRYTPELPKNHCQEPLADTSINRNQERDIPRCEGGWEGDRGGGAPPTSAAREARNSSGPLVCSLEITKNQPPRASTAPSDEMGSRRG